VLAVTSPTLSSDRLNDLLRQNEPPIIARISNDEVLLDMRTLLDGEEEAVFQALKCIAQL
jgi:L-seryl-tRNA(Ser) seleniumtransferase